MIGSNSTPNETLIHFTDYTQTSDQPRHAGTSAGWMNVKNLLLKWAEDVWLNWCHWSPSVIPLVSESQGELGSHAKRTVICGWRCRDLRWLFGGVILFSCSKADRRDSGTPVNISPTVPIILCARLVCTHLLQLNCRSSTQLWTRGILVSSCPSRNGEGGNVTDGQKGIYLLIKLQNCATETQRFSHC